MSGKDFITNWYVISDCEMEIISGLYSVLAGQCLSLHLPDTSVMCQSSSSYSGTSLGFKHRAAILDLKEQLHLFTFLLRVG